MHGCYDEAYRPKKKGPSGEGLQWWLCRAVKTLGGGQSITAANLLTPINTPTLARFLLAMEGARLLFWVFIVLFVISLVASICTTVPEASCNHAVPQICWFLSGSSVHSDLPKKGDAKPEQMHHLHRAMANGPEDHEPPMWEAVFACVLILAAIVLLAGLLWLTDAPFSWRPQ